MFPSIRMVLRRIRLKTNHSRGDSLPDLLEGVDFVRWIYKKLRISDQDPVVFPPSGVLKQSATATVTSVPAMIRQGNSMTGIQCGFS
jgi:hypothetical protein